MVVAIMYDVIISGGIKGIGKIIYDFLKDDYSVLNLYRQDQKLASTFIDAIKCDITSDADLLNLKKVLDASNSSPKLLINCAGINADAISWKMQNDDWFKVIDTILTGTFKLTRLVTPYMRESNGGTIINISSIVSKIGVPGTINYSSAKAGLEGFARTLAVELANKNITVNNLALGYFNTGLINQVSKEQVDKIILSTPMKRLGVGDDIVSAIKFLIDCRFITGQTIHLNGGLFFN